VMDVVTFLPGAAPPLAFDTEPLGTDSLIARDTLKADTWPDALTLADVSSPGGRKLVVQHGGREGIVGATGNATWKGMAVNGAWSLRSALLPGEVMGDPARHPPAHLYLKLTLACNSGGTGP
jgi:hypothetical protein